MKNLAVFLASLVSISSLAADGSGSTKGLASWYGEGHRGRLMANGKSFDPDQMTAASWFFPLGTRVRVASSVHPEYNVIVTITDRGPSKRLVHSGRIIDLAHAAFAKLASPDLGVVCVTVAPLDTSPMSTEN